MSKYKIISTDYPEPTEENLNKIMYLKYGVTENSIKRYVYIKESRYTCFRGDVGESVPFNKEDYSYEVDVRLVFNRKDFVDKCDGSGEMVEFDRTSYGVSFTNRELELVGDDTPVTKRDYYWTECSMDEYIEKHEAITNV